jgi:hypothetical protein
MKYAVETELGTMIYSYMSNFIKTGSGIQKLIGGIQLYSMEMA